MIPRLAVTLVVWFCLAGGAVAQAPPVTALTFPALTGRAGRGGGSGNRSGSFSGGGGSFGGGGSSGSW